MKRDEGIHVAKQLKAHLMKKGLPIKRVMLFGSVARGDANEKSDIDIAVITEAFRSSRLREDGEILLASKDIDLRIETVSLYNEDLKRPFFALAREIERTGIEV